MHILLHTTQAAESPDNLTIIPALQGDGSILLPFVSCHLAMLIMKKPSIEHAQCRYSHSSSFSRLIISHNYGTKGGGQCATFWPFVMLPTDSRTGQGRPRLKYRHFSSFSLFILYLLFLSDLFDKVESSEASCRCWHSSATV